MDIKIVGIAGGSGSGKTTLTRNIIAHFGERVSEIRHDDYYKSKDGISLEDRAKLNYDHPDAFDTDLLIEHLRALKDGKAIESPIYDYTIHNRSDKTRTVLPTKVIILEGILIFESQQLCDLLDMKIFVDTDADVRILRRIMRDVKSRGRSLDSVVKQYLETVKPMHEAFVEPSKRRADLIVPEGGKNPVAYGTLIDRIESFLNS